MEECGAGEHAQSILGSHSGVRGVVVVGCANVGDLVDAQRRHRRDRRGARRAPGSAAQVRARAFGALSRPLARRIRGCPARDLPGRHQARADGRFRPLGDRTFANARRRRGLSRRPRAYRRAPPRPLRRVEELRYQRRAGHIRAGCRRAFDLRRDDRRAARRGASRRPLRVGRLRARRQGGAGRRP